MHTQHDTNKTALNRKGRKVYENVYVCLCVCVYAWVQSAFRVWSGSLSIVLVSRECCAGEKEGSPFFYTLYFSNTSKGRVEGGEFCKLSHRWLPFWKVSSDLFRKCAGAINSRENNKPQSKTNLTYGTSMHRVFPVLWMTWTGWHCSFQSTSKLL